MYAPESFLKQQNGKQTVGGVFSDVGSSDGIVLVEDLQQRYCERPLQMVVIMNVSASVREKYQSK